MRSNGLKRKLTRVILFFVLVLAAVSGARARAKYKILHDFTGGNDGGALSYGLVMGAKGNLYGSSPFGGPTCNPSPCLDQAGDGCCTQTLAFRP